MTDKKPNWKEYVEEQVYRVIGCLKELEGAKIIEVKGVNPHEVSETAIKGTIGLFQEAPMVGIVYKKDKEQICLCLNIERIMYHTWNDTKTKCI